MPIDNNTLAKVSMTEIAELETIAMNLDTAMAAKMETKITGRQI